MWPETRKRGRYNFELEREFDSSYIITVVRTNTLSHAGHIIGRPTKGVAFLATLQEIRRKGRPNSMR
jgi:hypothetical protein